MNVLKLLVSGPGEDDFLTVPSYVDQFVINFYW